MGIISWSHHTQHTRALFLFVTSLLSMARTWFWCKTKGQNSTNCLISAWCEDVAVPVLLLVQPVYLQRYRSRAVTSLSGAWYLPCAFLGRAEFAQATSACCWLSFLCRHGASAQISYVSSQVYQEYMCITERNTYCNAGLQMFSSTLCSFCCTRRQRTPNDSV